MQRKFLAGENEYDSDLRRPPAIHVSLCWVYLWYYSNVIIYSAALSRKEMSQIHY